jgi:hypothetical protein
MTDASPDSLQLKAIQFLAARRLARFYLEIANTLDNHPIIVTSNNSIHDVPNSGPNQTTETSSSEQIKLDLVMWRFLLNAPVKTFDNQREKITYIFNFFIRIGQKNGLQGTPAVTSLESALVALGKEGEFEGTPKEKWEERIAQRTLAEIEQELDRLPNNRGPVDLPLALTADNTLGTSQTVSQVQLLPSPRDVYKAIPLFNIWDSLSFLYTTCVEDVNSQLAAELHLFQFRMVINALRQCDYFPSFAGPTTVGSAWSTSEPFLIGYATTCVGPKKGSHVAKEEMAGARCKFITTITSQLRVPITIGLLLNCRNRPGNCPEFVTWRFVCRDPGNYFSLCFSIDETDGKAKSLKFCEHCQDFAQLLTKHKINITDVWDKALLCDEEAMPFTRKGTRYPFRRLQSTNQVIKLSMKLPVPKTFSYHGIY